MTSYPDDNPKTVLGCAKPSITAIPPIAIYQIGQAMADGKRKYGLFNYREKRVTASTYIDAAYRHMMAWWDGEEVAEDSKVHHLAHAAACLCIILDTLSMGKCNDDRGPAGALSGWLKANTASLGPVLQAVTSGGPPVIALPPVVEPVAVRGQWSEPPLFHAMCQETWGLALTIGMTYPILREWGSFFLCRDDHGHLVQINQAAFDRESLTNFADSPPSVKRAQTHSFAPVESDVCNSDLHGFTKGRPYALYTCNFAPDMWAVYDDAGRINYIHKSHFGILPSVAKYAPNPHLGGKYIGEFRCIDAPLGLTKGLIYFAYEYAVRDNGSSKATPVDPDKFLVLRNDMGRWQGYFRSRFVFVRA